jgi:hypothetical protein
MLSSLHRPAVLSLAFLLIGCSEGVPKDIIQQIQPQIVDCLIIGDKTKSDANAQVSPATKKRMAAIAVSAAKKHWSFSDEPQNQTVNLIFSTSGSKYSCDFSQTNDKNWELRSIYRDGGKVR